MPSFLPTEWNSLPMNVVNAKTIDSFKNLIDNFYTEKIYKINWTMQ